MKGRDSPILNAPLLANRPAPHRGRSHFRPFIKLPQTKLLLGMALATLFLAACSTSSDSTSKAQVPPSRLKKSSNSRNRMDYIVPKVANDSIASSHIAAYFIDVEQDSTLLQFSVRDSVHSNLVASYRNGQLVKLATGSHGGFGLYLPNGLAHNYTAYYFAEDHLLFSKYDCYRYQQTGRCNPVGITVDTYFLKGTIIRQDIDDRIGSYFGCGCGMGLYFYQHQPELIVTNASEAKRLQQVAYAAWQGQQ